MRKVTAHHGATQAQAEAKEAAHKEAQANRLRIAGASKDEKAAAQES
jgi:hypothetical protein